MVIPPINGRASICETRRADHVPCLAEPEAPEFQLHRSFLRHCLNRG